MLYTQESSSTYTESNTSYTVNGVEVSSSHETSFQCSESTSLSITVNSASELIGVETLGKNDPFLQWTLDINDSKSFQKTFTHKNAGANATWNQAFTVPLRGEPELYIEIYDEGTVNELIGFAAIPINQVVYAQGGALNGVFDIYTKDNKKAGEVNLVLAAIGFPNSQHGFVPTQIVRGQSYVSEVHLKRCKSQRNKAIGVGVGAAVLGAAALGAAGYFGHKAYEDHENKKKEEEEENNRRREEQERFEHDKAELDQQKADLERQRAEDEERRRREAEERSRRESEERSHRESEERSHNNDEESHKKKKKDKKKKECRKSDDSDSDSDSGSDSGSDCDRKKKSHHKKSSCADDWDPVGTYSAGDKVTYKGRTYMCLQGHTSNPTWKPTDAHSLWEAV
ncbi:hypothetical protein DFQ28_005015 [Apophysomyces sp. BC1034]|nr:hypothetical protein DFQ30_000587 [Apophysomyces sp. BC1015]KAG0180298.1 hypothetical protein DFQ29_000917 [Apophysomyces sp. BC1021]KAG0194803.1 hypothetical protein DFQ28_005015 [Apophysomyces sp. BC1034]